MTNSQFQMRTYRWSLMHHGANSRGEGKGEDVTLASKLRASDHDVEVAATEYWAGKGHLCTRHLSS
jgi:stress response protein SCP2